MKVGRPPNSTLTKLLLASLSISPKAMANGLNEIARASALESGSCLDVLVAKKRIAVEEIIPGKKMLTRIVSMWTRMVINLSQDE